MGEAPVCQKVFGSICPGRCDKINIRNTLRNSAEKHSPLTQLFSGKCISHASTKGNMCEGIHKANLAYFIQPLMTLVINNTFFCHLSVA